MMKDINGSLRQIASDLGIDAPFVKGEKIPIHNCWHFTTDGNAVDYIFADEQDFIDGMNRIFIVAALFDIVILAFCLMDNHVHFILYGKYDDCNRFMHEYIRRTSMRISTKHSDKRKLYEVPIFHQEIKDDSYLKKSICYVIKNPPKGGLPYNAYDYPWSSGALYMRKTPTSSTARWTSPLWLTEENSAFSTMSKRQAKSTFKTNKELPENLRMIGEMIFPGEYVAYELVNKIFKTHKSFNYFMSATKDEDIEANIGIISRLSIPIQEMRQHKTEVCKELFGQETIRSLSTQQRLKLVKVLKSRYNSSPKQIVKMCGLVYDEVKNLI